MRGVVENENRNCSTEIEKNEKKEWTVKLKFSMTVIGLPYKDPH